MGNSSLFFQGLETETKRGKDLCGERNGTDGRSSFWVLLTLTAAEGLGFSIVRRGDFNLSCFAFSLVGLFCVEVAFFAGPSPFYFLRSFCFLFFCCVGFFPFPGVDFKRLQMVGFFHCSGMICYKQLPVWTLLFYSEKCRICFNDFVPFVCKPNNGFLYSEIG